MHGNYRPLKEKVWSKVDKSGDCWPWIGQTKDKDGYGLMSEQINGKISRFRVTRLIYVWEVGPLADSECVLHTCDNPRCCNPSHFFKGSKKDNAADAIKKGRHTKGEMQHLHKLTEAQVLEIRKLYVRYSREFGAGALAEMYGMDKSSIIDIVNRKTWKHI